MLFSWSRTPRALTREDRLVGSARSTSRQFGNRNRNGIGITKRLPCPGALPSSVPSTGTTLERSRSPSFQWSKTSQGAVEIQFQFAFTFDSIGRRGASLASIRVFQSLWARDRSAFKLN
ncbi:hypothetical protein SCHPADRAFT_48017 [Schizopora paradoxa]|uniref:Uncharacterized protein n=1 Tax=Schizopora paradoxa TaxID=27342 RepID=A0A0H2S6X0_9AGAM|nr:hypothetical protein SCHPADRAFT_48017 [Schizopora paradoxa]